MKKKVLITGISGMVGSHLADFLFKNTNWEIYGLIRWRSSLINLSHNLKFLDKRLFFLYSDIRDANNINTIIRNHNFNYCFHLAAQSYPQVSFTSAADTYETNILGTENLLSAFKEYSIKTIIHVCSSSEIFGRVKKENLPIDESCPFHPASPYAISKIGTDQISKYYAEAYKMKILTTRMFTHTGPRRGDVFAESTFAKQIARIEINLQKPTLLTGNLDSLRTWADVRDAVRAYYMLVTVNPKFGESYNIGGDYTCTVRDMLKTLLSFSKKKIKVITDVNRLRPIDADLQVPNTKKFRSHTGWEPQIKFRKTMLDLLNYWRKEVKFRKDIINR